MFSNALKSISSTNINSNYTVASQPTSTAGPWKIYDAKKKSTGKAYSVFVFDRKALDRHGSSLGRSGASAFKRAADEAVDRLKREAASLARLRHPSILELVEPVEDTRGGGLQFATEAVTASLASLLQEKDEQERAGGVGGRSSRYVTEDADGVRRRREIEIDELEIQKGLLQLGKALEFLHENAGLVHGNLTPDAVLVNAKSDWKISGLSFCSPAEIAASTGQGVGASAAFLPVNLHEILHMDARLPRTVQLNLDYSSPDIVMDNNLTPATDLFSLGLLCVALYNTPHKSPLEAHGSLSSYKRLFTSSASVPSTANNYLSARPLPRELSTHVLPRLLARRPAQRMNAREFQTSEYFDNILVSTIRFLDAFPAKTAGEKTAFLRGLVRVLPSFPKSVMEKKVLPALLDELKDKELAPQILQNVFKIIDLLPSAKRAFSDRVLPGLKELFLAPGGKPATERDPVRDASLMVVLDRLSTIANNTNGKEFKDDVLPIVATALESSTPSVVDAALRCIPVLLPVLDFSTIKHELFPVVATIFSKTSSLAIKIRGLQAFVILCGGSADTNTDNLDGDYNSLNDGLDGLAVSDQSKKKKSTSSSTALDKYTMQEKIVPLIKAIKTKEPAVMVESLNVLRVVGRVADAEFVAMDILPILWSMSLGPLLNLQQFQAFMKLIKSLSTRVEDEQIKKLQELSSSAPGVDAHVSGVGAFSTFGNGGSSSAFDMNGGGGEEDDFERLVKGKTGGGSLMEGMSTQAGAGLGGAGGGGLMDAGWDSMKSAGGTPAVASPSYNSNGHRNNMSSARASTSSMHSGGGVGGSSSTPSAAAAAATFSWSTPSSTPGLSGMPPTLGMGNTGGAVSNRTVTPDLGGFPSMVPSSTQFSQALPAQPLSGNVWAAASSQPQQQPPQQQQQPSSQSGGINWSTAGTSASNPWASPSSSSSGMGMGMGMAAQQQQRTVSASSGFSLPPPPQASSTGGSGFSLPPPPGGSGGWGSSSTSTSGFGATAPTTTSTMGVAPNYNRANLGLGQPAAAPAASNSMGMGNMSSMGMNMNMNMGMGMNMGTGMNTNNINTSSGMMPTQPGKTGLDKYESLL